MNRILYIVLFLAFAAYGQQEKAFSLGFRGGLNLSHFHAEYDNDYYEGSGSYKPSLNYQLGLVFDWALNARFHLQPGLMFILKGTKIAVCRK